MACLAGPAGATDYDWDDIFGAAIRAQAESALAVLGFATVPSETASALALDLTAVGPARWESVAASLEAGLGLYAGVLPSEGTANVESARRLILDAFERVGLAAENLGALTITPACGLASSTVAAARHTQRSAVDLARDLTEEGAR